MEEINLKELFDFFISKFYVVIISFLVILILGDIYSANFRTPMYHSTTTIVLVSEAEQVTSSEVSLNNSLASTYSNIITSRKVLSQVIYNLNSDLSVSQLQDSIKVSQVTGTQIISIVVSNKDNKLAQQIAEEMTKVFIAEIPNYYDIKNVAILDEASFETTPYNINIMKENLIYGGIGIILGCVILFMIFYMDTSIKDPETIEDKLGLSVLGTVPKVGGKHGKRK
jgi:capsular polysaccharide biosynthesis protein